MMTAIDEHGHEPDLAGEALAATQWLRGRLDPQLIEQWPEDELPERLLAHLRHRQTPRLFDRDQLKTIPALTRKYDPEEHAWEQRIADEAVAGRVYAASNAYCDRFVSLDDRFDFTHYEHWDPQAIHGLNRHRWFATLARHYWEDQDTRYFNALMREWDYFCKRVPLPGEEQLSQLHAIGPEARRDPPYSELDTFIRLTNWWWAFWLSVPAAQITPWRCVVLLARALRWFDYVAARGIRVQEHNFTSMQMEAIYLWALSLPEIPAMRAWRHAARNNLQASMNRAVAEDGSQWEQSAGYHAGCIRWYGSAYLLGQRNGEAWGPTYTQRLLAMGQFLDAIITPDGKLPLLSDSDRNDGWQAPLSLLRCILPETRWQHVTPPTYLSLWLSGGETFDADAAKAASAETPSVQYFKDAGLAVVRHRDADRGIMLILDNGPNRAGHAHHDNLTVHYEAFGRPVLTDPGRWIYDHSAERQWVLHPPSHNTVFIEEPPLSFGDMMDPYAFQVIGDMEDPRVSSITVEEDQGLVNLSTTFRGYVADPEALVKRTVVMPVAENSAWVLIVDHIEAPCPHRWTNSFLLPTPEPVKVESPDGATLSAGYACHTIFDSDLTLYMQALAALPLSVREEERFWCSNYAVQSPARWVRFASEVQCDTRAFLFTINEVDPPVTWRLDGRDMHLTWKHRTFVLSP